MNNNLLPIHFAPLQGYTDAVYRLAHARIFGGIDTYYSPFVRVEHGEIRRKDARDISSKNNREGIHPDSPADCITARQAGTDNRSFHREQLSGSRYQLGMPFPNVGQTSQWRRNVAVSGRGKRSADRRNRKIPSNPFLRQTPAGLGKCRRMPRTAAIVQCRFL